MVLTPVLSLSGLDETNLANFGSELEKEHRKEEGALETAWNYEGSPIGLEP
jgi:gelsolin